jgi:polyferredoxin
VKALAINTLDWIWKVLCIILILPFIGVGFLLVKLMGGDPMSMDGMGTDFIIMIITALIAATATFAFLIGYLL